MPAPRNPNTAAATAAVRRKAQDRKAAELRGAGWTAYPPSGEGHDKLPMPPLDALRAHKALTGELHQWAPTVHRLVRDRIAALMEAYGRFDNPLETAESHASRVLARGQHPFPTGQCIYDELDCNTGYSHVGIGHGLDDDGDNRITFSGTYPHWAADGESYELRIAEIHCPGWLVTEPDGVDRYRRETDRMAEQVRRARAEEDAAIAAAIDRIRE